MRILKLLTLFLFITSLLYAQPKNYMAGEILVQLKSGHTPEMIMHQYSGTGFQIKELVADQMNIWLIGYDEGRVTDTDMLAQLKSNPYVRTAQFNHFISHRPGYEDPIYTPAPGVPTENTPNDTRFAEQWGLHNTGQSGGTVDADIDAPEAWDLGTGGVSALGDTVVVAVVDGGFDMNHADLNFYRNWGEIPGNNIDDDNNGYIDDVNGWNAYNQNGTITSSQHGTHVAGIVGAIGNNALGVAGVNWKVKVMAIQGSSSTESIVLRAYNYVLKMRRLYNQTNGAQGAFVVATNASFGVDFGQPSNYPLWCAVYDSLGLEGILSCGATANANTNVDLQGDIPTACASDYMIAVTNTTRTDTKNSGAAYGLTTIDLGAPGTSVLSTVPSNGYSSLTGTSMATPMVAGAIGLMFATANPGLMQAYKTNPAATALQFKQFLFDATDPIPALQGITVTGGRLNLYNALLAIAAPPDTIPPTQVTDLAFQGATSNSIQLGWTAPLDTTRNGVVGYDIRKSLTPITDLTSFLAAQPVGVSVTPDTAGAAQTLSVTGLAANTVYHFALRATDLWGNYSQVSNSAQGSTWNAPMLSITPDSMMHTLVPAQVKRDSFVVSNSNTQLSTLDYTIRFDNNTFPQGSVSTKLLFSKGPDVDESLRNKENPAVVFGQSVRGSGGPDAFGYKWIDSDEPNGPAYIWNDISTTGTQITTWTPTSTISATDEGYAAVSMPFPFPYYGINYSQLFVSTNGLITLSAPTTNIYSNSSLPSLVAPNGLIAPFWDDLDGTTTGRVYTKTEGNTVIIQFQNWLRYNTSGSSLTFQIVLHKSGKIVFYYNTMTSTTLNSATIGLENETGTIGLVTAYNAAYIKNNHAVMYQAAPEWLNAGTYAGTLYNGNSVSVQVEFDAADYPAGMYSMDMIVETNDPVSPTRVVPVRMQLTNIVPVELVSFSAVPVHGDVLISWSTATELNNESFMIERKSGEGSWEKAGETAGHGTTSERQNYTFTDRNMKSGTYRYRLVQRDFDGTTTVSAEIEVNVLLPLSNVLEQNYPNPFNPSTKIRFALAARSEARIDIYNSLGELVATPLQGSLEAGYHEAAFNATLLPAGVYFYQLTAGEFVSVKKLVLTK